MDNCPRCKKGSLTIDAQNNESFCSKCGYVNVIPNEEKECVELHTMCEDGKGGYRICIP